MADRPRRVGQDYDKEIILKALLISAILRVLKCYHNAH